MTSKFLTSDFDVGRQNGLRLTVLQPKISNYDHFLSVMVILKGKIDHTRMSKILLYMATKMARGPLPKRKVIVSLCCQRRCCVLICSDTECCCLDQS